MVVHQFYSTTVFSYICCSSSLSLDQDRLVAMLDGVLTPMLTCITYSVWNMEVKEILRRIGCAVPIKCDGNFASKSLG